MANIIFKDGYGYEKVRKATGSGTQADPFIPVYECEADLTFTTPVPVVGAGIDIPVTMDGEPLEDTAAGDLAAINAAVSALETTLPDTAAGDLAAISLATTALAESITAGSNIIGKVSIDQTTPGTTNAVHASIVGTKGSVTTAHNAITATTTSTEVDCTGYNGLIVHATMTDSKEWEVKVVGSPTTGGTFVDCYDAATQMTLTSSTGKCVLWKGIPEFVKIVATENSDGGACTVVVQPVMI